MLLSTKSLCQLQGSHNSMLKLGFEQREYKGMRMEILCYQNQSGDLYKTKIVLLSLLQ